MADPRKRGRGGNLQYLGRYKNFKSTDLILFTCLLERVFNQHTFLAAIMRELVGWSLSHH